MKKYALFAAIALLVTVSSTGLAYAAKKNAWVKRAPLYVGANDKVGVGIVEPVTLFQVAQDNPNTGGVAAQISISGTTNPKEGLKIGYNTAEHFAWLQANNYVPGAAPYLPLNLQPESGNVGINTSNPGSRLTVNNGDVYINTITSGVILKAPDGHCARGTLANDNTLSFQTVACPS